MLRHGGIFARSPDALHSPKDGPSSHAVLAATPNCRFREGFASVGMLCNNPPIPLRVLDFLPHTEDLLNLALVCKATHQAGHVLLQREVRCAVCEAGGRTLHDKLWAVCLESAGHVLSKTKSGSHIFRHLFSGATQEGEVKGPQREACAVCKPWPYGQTYQFVLGVAWRVNTTECLPSSFNDQ